MGLDMTPIGHRLGELSWTDVKTRGDMRTLARFVCEVALGANPESGRFEKRYGLERLLSILNWEPEENTFEQNPGAWISPTDLARLFKAMLPGLKGDDHDRNLLVAKIERDGFPILYDLLVAECEDMSLICDYFIAHGEDFMTLWMDW